MRTTIKIDDGLLAEAKARAARAGTTLNAVVEDALRSAFARRGDAPTTRRMELPTFAESRVRPGVDLDDSAALLEHMEGIGS
ncbi:MAG TPA: type II toxin-antitoxin system VapB family antitoxin [Candidatus Limnocylindria bacterium]